MEWPRCNLKSEMRASAIIELHTVLRGNQNAEIPIYIYCCTSYKLFT